MSRFIQQLKTLAISNRERRLQSRGYHPGATSGKFRLWWNDNDECIVEEIDAEYEGSEFK